VTTTETIHTCVENAERQVRMFPQRVQWTPLLLVISIFTCENSHSVALGLQNTLLEAASSGVAYSQVDDELNKPDLEKFSALFTINSLLVYLNVLLCTLMYSYVIYSAHELFYKHHVQFS